MTNWLRVLTAVIMVFSGINFYQKAYCEEAGPWGKEIKTMKCLITKIDLVEGSLTVNGVEEVRFVVYPEAKAYRGDEDIGMPDLRVGKHAIVEYYYNSQNEPRLIKVKDIEGE